MIKDYNYYKDLFIRKAQYYSINKFDAPTYFNPKYGFVIYKLDSNNNTKIEFLCGQYKYLIEPVIQFANENHCNEIYAYMRFNSKVIARSFHYQGTDLTNLTDYHGYKASIVPDYNRHCLVTGNIMNKVTLYLK